MEGRERRGGTADERRGGSLSRSKKHQQQVAGTVGRSVFHDLSEPPYHQPPLQAATLSYSNDVKKVSSLLKKPREKKSERFSTSKVEYFVNDSQKWTDQARLSVNKTRTKLCLDIGTAGNVKKLDRSLSLSSVSSLSRSQLNQHFTCSLFV